MSKYLLILRSPPGAGKSTYAKRFLNTYYKLGGYCSSIVCSADNYFLREDGVYDFNPRLLKNAHKWCYELVEKSMRQYWGESIDLIILDNCNLQHWEYEKYIELANKYDYKVKIKIVGEIDPNNDQLIDLYFNRCIHKVPRDKIKQMMERWEE